MKRLIRIALAVILLLVGYTIFQALVTFGGLSIVAAIAAIATVIGLGLIVRRVLR